MPYPSSLKYTHSRVYQHYQCKDLTSSAVWAAAYWEDLRKRHFYKMTIQSPTSRYQLGETKLSVDNSKFFHLSTVGKRVLVP